MKLVGSTILITGGATGIGLSLATRLSETNQVIICGRSEEALAQAQAKTPSLVTRVCDLTDSESRLALIRWLEISYPGLNVLINNAGVQTRRDFATDAGVGSIDQEIAINFAAPIHFIAALLPILRRQSEASIVNVTSGLAFSPMADVPVYSATKAALHSFTLSLRHQLQDTGIKVIELAPPIVETGLGGGTRSGGAKNRVIVTADAFAEEALRKLAEGRDEVMIGIAEQTRQLGEALFSRMNVRH